MGKPSKLEHITNAYELDGLSILQVGRGSWAEAPPTQNPKSSHLLFQNFLHAQISTVWKDLLSSVSCFTRNIKDTILKTSYSAYS